MAEMTRTFVALEIPEPLGGKLAKLQGRLESEVPGVRWTTGRPYHLTLAFLGDVAESDLSAVRAPSPRRRPRSGRWSWSWSVWESFPTRRGPGSSGSERQGQGWMRSWSCSGRW